jgi:hypothetical protein
MVVRSEVGIASNASMSKLIFFLPHFILRMDFTPFMPPPIMPCFQILVTTLLGQSAIRATAAETPRFSLFAVPLRCNISEYM